MKLLQIIISSVAILSVVLVGIYNSNITADDGVCNWESDLIFSHANHVIENELGCETCHMGVEDSETGADDLLPKEETCLNCHEKTEETCGMCHTNPDNPKIMPRITDYSKKFSHKKHIEEGADCNSCHTDVAKKERVAKPELPDMHSCMNCHETPENTKECYVCHEQDYNLIPPDHTEMWLDNHSNFVEAEGNNCQTCHQEQYCIDCHTGENLFNESHPPHFMATHAMSYLMRESNCQSCHEGLESCRECHMEINYIIPPDHMPSTWIGEHMFSGKINADKCVVCHERNEPRCMDCHKE